MEKRRSIDRIFSTENTVSVPSNWSIGWTPSKMEEDIWMKDCGDHYEYIAVYVDDLMIASKNPQAIIDSLEGEPVKFTLKGMEANPITAI